MTRVTRSSTTRNSTDGRLQREKNEQSTTASSSTIKKQANTRTKRGQKTKILEQTIGTTQETTTTVINELSPASTSATTTTNTSATSKRGRKRKAVTEGSITTDQVASDDPKTNLLEQESAEPIVPGTTTAGAATNRSVKKRKNASENNEGGNRKSKKAKNEIEKTEQTEERLARFRAHCTNAISERIHRAETQRLYMVNRKIVDEYRQEFAILGSTGNVYTVTIALQPNCTCPDFMKGNLCKHIFFIYLRVLRLDRNSQLIYQNALLTEELRSIFANAAPDPTILANKYVRDQYETMTSGSKPASDDERRRPIEGDCPICYEPLKEEDRKNIVWCKGSCGNNLHNDCFEQWKKSKRGGDVTCVYCRSNWVRDSKASLDLNEEGYYNLGDVQGMDTERDTTTYFRKNYRYGRYSWY